MMSLYVHIPFCHRICTYCDFVKEVVNPGKIDRYLKALNTEFKLIKHQLSDVKTVFIGGGTPSSLSVADLTKLLQTIGETVDLMSLDEFTIECNPEDITSDMVKRLKSSGVTRVSLGVQSFNDQHLAFLNRTHRLKDIKRAVQMLKTHQISQISVDMMFGLVGQTMTELDADIDALLGLNVDHISYYSLIVEPGTKLHTLIEKGAVRLIDETLETRMFERVIDRLTLAGYKQYEVSNFAKDDAVCLHNLRIWRDQDYLGVGVGAHSKMHDKRFTHTHRLKHYLESIEQGDLSYQYYPYEAKRDLMLMGLRLIEGVSLKQYQIRFKTHLYDDYPVLKTYIKQGLLEEVSGMIRFTKKGLFLGNNVFEIF